MAERQTAITRNMATTSISSLPPSDYRSYCMFADAGFDVAMFTSPTAVSYHNFAELALQF